MGATPGGEARVGCSLGLQTPPMSEPRFPLGPPPLRVQPRSREAWRLGEASLGCMGTRVGCSLGLQTPPMSEPRFPLGPPPLRVQPRSREAWRLGEASLGCMGTRAGQGWFH